MKEILKGHIYYTDLSPTVGSEQGGVRPVLVIQNNVGNHYSPTTIIAIITSRHTKAKLPTHIWLESNCGLRCESMVECEQLRTIDKSRLKNYIGTVDQETMAKVDQALRVSLAL